MKISEWFIVKLAKIFKCDVMTKQQSKQLIETIYTAEIKHLNKLSDDYKDVGVENGEQNHMSVMYKKMADGLKVEQQMKLEFIDEIFCLREGDKYVRGN